MAAPHAARTGCVELARLPERFISEVAAEVACSPGAVLLAAFHAFLTRTHTQEVASLAVQPRHLLLHAAADSAGAALVPVACPPVGPGDSLSGHAAKLHAQLLAAAESGAAAPGPTQAGVAGNAEAAAAAAAGAGLGLALLLTHDSSDSLLQARLVFSRAAVSDDAAALAARHFRAFLAGLASASPAQPPAALLAAPLMDAAERELVLRGFNASAAPSRDAAALAHSLFAAAARAAPDAACVVFEGCVFSYGEMDAASSRIAHHLRCQAGVAPGGIVGVLLRRGPLLVAALLGVLRSGAAYLPLDHHHPDSRIAFMLDDAAVQAVVAEPDLLPKLPCSLGAHVLQLHPELALPGGAPPEGAEPVRARLPLACLGAAAVQPADWTLGQLGSPETPCYIIYTSGSTGKPKGVVVLHKGLAAYTAWFRAHFGIIAADVFLQKTPINFDASVDELWTSLTAGASLVVAPPEAHRDVHSVMGLISRHGVTTASAVPSQVHLLAREILAAHGAAAALARAAPCASLRRVLSGGEALTAAMAGDIRAVLPHCELHNTYGPTETTVGITSWLYEPPPAPGPAPAAATVPIGRGVHGSRLYVLDAALQPVPVGVPGQLFISGVQVAGGYLNRPELTAAAFVANPFCEGAGTHTATMYRTGDLVRWLPGHHACLEFLGRVDHQVKLRGFRIELQEVEAAMGALLGVRQVVAALVKHPATQQDHLVAWCSPVGLDRAALLQQLHGTLPEHMVPTAVVLLEQLPLLVSEKVDRKALPPPDFARDCVSPAPPAAAAASGGADAPLEPLAAHVAGVWASVLGLRAAPRARDDFFATCGGNSLLAGRMNGRLRAELRLQGMSGLLIYQHSTLAAFARALAAAGASLPQPHQPSSGSGGGAEASGGSFSIGAGGVAGNAAGGSEASFSSSISFFPGSASSTSSASLPRVGSCSSVASLVSSSDSSDAGGLSASFSAPVSSAKHGWPAPLSQAPSVLLGAVPTITECPSLTLTIADAFEFEAPDVPRSTHAALAGAVDTDAGRSRLKRKLTLPPLFGGRDQADAAAAAAAGRGAGKRDQRRASSPASLAGAAGARRAVRPSVALATLVQGVALCCVSGTTTLLLLTPMLLSMYALLAVGYRALLLLPAIELAMWLLLAGWAIAGKWLAVGRYMEGDQPLWGACYLRHWVATQFVLTARQSFVPLIRCTELLCWFWRALGVSVGRDVVIDSDDLIGFDLITLGDGAVLDAAAGVSAITFAAGTEDGQFPTGTMRLRRAAVGARAAVGPHAVVVQSAVPDDAVVLPCVATTNPPAAWVGAPAPPTHGAAAQARVRSHDAALGVASGLAAMWLASLLLSGLAYPVVVAYWQLWLWLARGTQQGWMASTSADLAAAFEPLHCWLREPDRPAHHAAVCAELRDATLLALLAAPVVLLVSGQLVMLLVVPLKWLLVGRLSASPATASSTWGQRFRKQLLRCLLEHPTTRRAAFLWTGTALFNAWLRGLGAKVGSQAWIGEDLKLREPDLVEVGDCVSICSSVSLVPCTAAAGAAPIRIQGGADVTNQTALYPGVTVKPGAVLGVFTYAEAGRTFPRHSITQGPMVLSPGQPESPAAVATQPSQPGGAAVVATGAAPEPADARRVGAWRYAAFNATYLGLMLLIMPMQAVLTEAPFALVTVALLFSEGVWAALLAAPAAYALSLAATFGWMAAVKRVLLPRCQGSSPFYSYTHTAWMIDGLLLYFQQAGMLRALSGSQLAVWFYRLHGARIGRGVLLLGLQSQEPDCLTIGDYSVCDDMAFVMAHTVENRCLKFHDVAIGSRVTIGCGSCVLPGCVLSDGSRLGDVSLLMKGETLPPGAVWRGVPAVPCEDCVL